MGICASLLRRKAKKRYPEPRRGMPKALFVVRGDRRQCKPEALVSAQAHGFGRTSQLHRPAAAGTGGSRRWQEKGRHDGGDTDAPALDRRRLRLQMPRLPCGSSRSVAVEPVATMRAWSKAAADSPPPPPPPGRYCRTPTAAPMTPGPAPMTPMRPVWQRRILMGMRCELPRFSGLILYDEHGRPIQIGTPGRRNRQQGKKKATRTSTATTLRDLL